jgi:hypothetical protein
MVTRNAQNVPTFVAVFEDGTTCFDVARGISNSKAAYESRMRKLPPPLSEEHFERDGVAFNQLDRWQLLRHRRREIT